MDQPKRNISVRLSSSDIKKIKDISARLGVKESELFRFSVKNTLTKLMPLNDSGLKGADLIPAWLECGNDLLNYFDIDVDKLDEILNKDIDQCAIPVGASDLDLIVLSSINKNYVVKKLSEVIGEPVDPGSVDETLCEYLRHKYVLGRSYSSSKLRGAITAPI